MMKGETVWVGRVSYLSFRCSRTVLQIFGLLKSILPASKSFITAQMAEWYGASASGAVDLGLISSRVKPMTLKLPFTASLLDVQH